MMVRLLLAVFVGLVVGLAVGFVMFPMGSASPEVAAPTPQSPVSDAGSEMGRPELVRPPARPSSAPVPEELVLPVAARTETDPVEPVDGTGQIWGQVTDTEGVGVADVLLRAEPIVRPDYGLYRSKLGQGPPEVSLVSVAREAAKKYAKIRAGLSETRTDAGGHFRLRGLSPADFTVTGYRRGFVIESKAAQYSGVPAGTEIDFVARPVQSVRVRVLLPNGEPAEEAVILYMTDRSGRMKEERYSWTPTDDTLQLTTGTVELRALAGVFYTSSRWGQDSDMQSTPVSIELVPGAPVGPVELQLEVRTGIRGLVVSAKDRVLIRAGTLHLLPLADGQPVDLKALANAEPSFNVSSGEEYAFLDLAPGRYALGIQRQRGVRDPVVAHWVVDVGSGIVRCDIEIPPLDPKGYVVARVLGPGGERLNGVRFKLGRSSGQQMRDVDGNYCVPIPESARSAYHGGGGDNPFRLEASHSRYGTQSVELARGQAEVEIRFTQPAQLEILVTGYLGSGLIDRVGVSVHRPGVAEPIDPGRAAWWRGVLPVGHDGLLEFGALEPGRYDLKLEVRGRKGLSSKTTTVATLSVELSAGKNTVSISLPPLYSLDVVVPGADEGSRVALTRNAADGRYSSGWNSSFDEAGGVRFDGLLGGEYVVQVQGEIRGRMRIQVPRGTVVFEPDDG